MADLDDLKRLEVKNQADSPAAELCVDFSKEEFQRSLRPELGVVYGAFSGGKMIGIYVVVRPIEEENLGLDLGLAPQDCHQLLHCELAHVLTPYRGNGLMQFLYRQSIQAALENMRDIRYLCATIYPHNMPSLISTLNEDFMIVALKIKYSGYLRYILLKRVDQEKLVHEPGEHWIQIENLEEQQAYLDKGYVGLAVEDRDDSKWVRFEKIKWR